MSKMNKFVGGGRTGDTASGGSSTRGNVYGSGYNDRASQAPKGQTVSRKIMDETHPGDDKGTRAISTHNNVQTFMRTAQSRGHYSGPSFRSLNNSYKDMQRTNTSEISRFQNPSSAGGSVSRGKGTGSGDAGYGTDGK